MKSNKGFVAVLILILSSIAFSQVRTPTATVSAFYRYSNARSSTFDRRHIEARKQWYAPALTRAFRSQLSKDRAYLKRFPTDKPYFGDGLDFRPMDESCDINGRSVSRKWATVSERVRKSKASVRVKFAYPKGCTIEPEFYTVELLRIGGKWLISDWIYSDGTTLTGEMRKHRYE